MEFILGLLIMAGWVAAVWMLIEALNVPDDLWRRLGDNANFSGMKTKNAFLAWWFVGGFFSFGLIPIGLACDFARTLRPWAREARRSAASAGRSPLGSSALTNTATVSPGGSEAAPAGWYSDPAGRHEHRYWDGTDWTLHVADDGITGTDQPALAPPPLG